MGTITTVAFGVLELCLLVAICLAWVRLLWVQMMRHYLAPGPLVFEAERKWHHWYLCRVWFWRIVLLCLIVAVIWLPIWWYMENFGWPGKNGLT